MRETSKKKVFGGNLHFFTHASKETATDMNFSIFVPGKAKNQPVPALLWLSGLTCSEHNFIEKAGATKVADQLGLALICPDTSPRNTGIPGESDSWDFGTGAGFYLDATQRPWNQHFRMESYLTKELLPALISGFPLMGEKIAISGHSMGGHGALTLAIKYPELFKSVSAFAPICHPIDCPWGQKAFSNYLGQDKTTWKNYDACELINTNGFKSPILVDQGTEDTFLVEQLHPKALEKVCKEQGVPLELNMREGYDHSYYFVSSFIEEHLHWHMDKLRSVL